MAIRRQFRLGLSLLAAGCAAAALLVALSALYPAATDGLSNGHVYTGALGFLMARGLEPLWWLCCAAVAAGANVALFDRAGDAALRRAGWAVLGVEAAALALFFADGLGGAVLPTLTAWLLVALLGLAYAALGYLRHRAMRLSPVIFALAVGMLALGGFMRLFLTM